MRKQAFYYNGKLSDFRFVSGEVPQESILGPLLSLMYVNDMENCLQQLQLIMYADDTVLCVADTDKNRIQEELSANIKGFSDWVYENELVIQLGK